MLHESLQKTRHWLAHAYLTDAGKQAALNFAWLGLLTVLANVCAFASVLLITNHLGGARFGILALGFSLQPFLLTLGAFGTRMTIIREGTRGGGSIGTLATSHFVITISCSVLVALAVITASFMLPLRAEERFVLAAVALANIGGSAHMQAFFDVRHRQSITAALQLLTDLGTLIALLIAIQVASAGLYTIAAIFAGKWLILSPLSILAYLLGVDRLNLQFSWPTTGALLRSGWPLVLAGLLMLAPSSTGIVFVRAFHDPADVGIFGLAQQVSGGFLMLALLGVRIVEPHVVGRYGMTPSFLVKLAAFKLVYLGGLGCALFFAVAVLIRIFFRPEFHASILPCGLLIGAAIAFTLGRIAASYLTALHYERGVLWSYAIGTGAFVLLAAATVPRFSYWGACWAVLGASVVGSGICVWLAYQVVARAPRRPSSLDVQP